jgi:hypothetical protein
MGVKFFLLAREGGQAVGRLAILYDENYLRHNRENTAFFYLFECFNRMEAAHALFQAGFDWARSQGLERIIGPHGFTVFNGLGLLVDGFEYRPAFGLPYNLPYYPALVEAAGFSSKSELVSGYLDEKMIFPEKVFKAAELIKKRRGLHIANLKSRRDIQKIVIQMRDLYNQSLATSDGNIPLTQEDVNMLANQMMWFADPRLIKIVMKDDQPVGFLLAYPDISAALQQTRGNLLPIGWLQILVELKRTKWININGAGMIEGYRGLGGTAILFSEMYKSVAESRYRFADLVQIGTDNDAMMREMESYGIKFYKRHRLYEREL